MSVTTGSFGTVVALPSEGVVDNVDSGENKPNVPCRIPSNDHRDVTRFICWDFARSRYPSSTIIESPNQGRCSYTLLLPKDNTILQFRPPTHRLDLSITTAARTIFGELVPSTRFLGVINPATAVCGSETDHPLRDCNTMIAYASSMIHGTPLASLPNPLSNLQRESLVRSLARRYFAPSYHASHRPSSLSPPPPPSPPPPVSAAAAAVEATATTPTEEKPPPPKRKLGFTLQERITQLQTHLPPRFTPVVTRVADVLEAEIEAGLPWALTHGDLLGGAGNLLVSVSVSSGSDSDSVIDRIRRGEREGKVSLTGLVDWAEGEWLPFGVGLYGLEEVLGRTVEVDGGKRFEYYPDAERLRTVFWEELGSAVPELVEDRVLRERVEMARLLGLLLWYGIAL